MARLGLGERLHPRPTARHERLDDLHRHPATMVLGQGRLKVMPGGKWLIEEVAHGTVLAVDLFGGGVGRGMGAPRFGGAELLEELV